MPEGHAMEKHVVMIYCNPVQRYHDAMFPRGLAEVDQYRGLRGTRHRYDDLVVQSNSICPDCTPLVIVTWTVL
jgi:hypothetical protein